MFAIRLKTHWLVFFFFLWSFAYFYNGGGGNQVARYNQTRAIVEKGQLYVNGIGYPSDDQILIDGRWYSSKAPGTSLLGVPPYAVFHAIGSVLGPKNPRVVNGVAHLTIIATVGIPSALTGMALYCWLVGIGIGAGGALLGSASVILGTHFFPYATMFFGHSLAGALAFLSYFFLWQAQQKRAAGEDSGYRVLYAGLLASGAVLTEYPLAILVGLLTLHLLSTRPTRRELAYWAIGGAVGGIILMVYNVLAFGNPLSVSYLNYASSARNTFPVHSQGVGGVTAPKWNIFREIVWGDTRGILWFAPIVALWIPSVIYVFWKRRALWREVLLSLLGGIAFLIFNSGYGDSIRYWGGANSAGPRHLVPMMPFIGLTIGVLVGSGPWLLGSLVLVSIAVSLMVTAVMPQVPMLYPNPFSEFLIPYFLNGRLGVHRGGLVSSAMVTSDSIAYNLGRWIGLPGAWSLLPLFLVVGGLLWVFSQQVGWSRRMQWMGLGMVGLLTVAMVGIPVSFQASQSHPLEGPGVLGAFYTERNCKGPLLKLERFETFRLEFDKGVMGPLRPYPGFFCGILRTTVTVPQGGLLAFQLRGGQGRLQIDGETWFQPSSDSRPGEVQREMRELTAGPHSLELTIELPVTTNRFELSWLPPGNRTWSAISLDRMAVSAEEVRRARADRL